MASAKRTSIHEPSTDITLSRESGRGRVLEDITYQLLDTFFDLFLMRTFSFGGTWLLNHDVVRNEYRNPNAVRDTKEELQDKITRLEGEKKALEEQLELQNAELLQRDTGLEQSKARSVRLLKPMPSRTTLTRAQQASAIEERERVSGRCTAFKVLALSSYVESPRHSSGNASKSSAILFNTIVVCDRS